jgi:hypothetical protein
LVQRLKSLLSLLLLPLFLLAGCSKRNETEEAAQALADRLFPGELEVLESHTRFPANDGYVVIFRARPDHADSRVPLSYLRVALEIADPAQCNPGSRCESALRTNYESAKMEAAETEAVDTAFTAGGTTPLVIPELRLSPLASPSFASGDERKLVDAKAWIAVRLGNENRAAVMASIRSCVERWIDRRRATGGSNRAALPWSSYPARLELNFLDPGAESAVAFTSRIREQPSAAFMMRHEEIIRTLLTDRRSSGRYRLVLQIDASHQIGSERLEIELPVPQEEALGPTLARQVDAYLASQPDLAAARADPSYVAAQSRMDDADLDIVHAYVFVYLNGAEKNHGPVDAAVALRYRLSTGEADGFRFVRDIRDEKGLNLPPL